MFPQGMHPTGSSDAFHSKDIGRLLLQCPDRIGVVAAVSAFLAEAGASIISLAQYSTEPQGGWFMQRTVFHRSGLAAARRDGSQIRFHRRRIRHSVPIQRGRQTQTSGDHGLTHGSLPAGPAVA